MSENWCVYMHTNKINKKVYVGITSKDVDRRWLEGGGYTGRNKDGSYRQPKFAKAIDKYGWDGFDHIVFAEGLTHDEACHMEKLLIAFWDSMNNGYNCTEGGEGVSGIIRSDEWRRKQSEAQSGKVPSEKTRQIWREQRKGKNNGMYGRHHTEEAKKKMSDSRGVKIYCVEEDKFYNSAKEAAEAHGCCRSNIKNAVCGISKTACGMHWLRASDVEKLQDKDLQNAS